MADAPWSDPNETSFFQINRHIGALVLVAVNEYIPSFPTKQGEGPVVRAEVALIDGPGVGERYPDAIFFGQRIVPQLKSSLGSLVLGRIMLGESTGGGKNAPYQLEKATPEDAVIAEAWVKEYGLLEPNPISQTAHQQPAGPNTGQPDLPPPPPYPSRSYSQPAGVGADDEPPF